MGYRIANLARDLFAEGALSSAFIPTFTRYLTTKSQEEARELSNITATLLIAIAGAVCVIGMVFSSSFVELFAPGFHAVPGKFELATRMVRTMFPFLLLIALAAQAQGILNSCRQFGIPALSSSIFNLISVLAGLALGVWLGPSLGISRVQGMAYGVLFGGAGQLAFQLPSVWRAGFAWRPSINLHHEGVRQILRLMGPAVIGGAAAQINLLVNTHIAAGLRDATGHIMNGPVSWLVYAYRFVQLPTGLFAISIASATLPRISTNAALGDLTAFRETLSRSLATLFLLTIPSAAGLMMLGESMIGIVFQHGHFLAYDTHQAALALSGYALGLAGYGATKVLGPAFFTLGDARTPMLVSLASVLVNGITAVSFVHGFGLGFQGLAFSVAIVATTNAIVLAALIRRKIGGIAGRALAISLIKIAAATLLMSGAVLAVKTASHNSRILTVAFGVPIGGIVFYFAASAARVPEIAATREAVLAKVGRR